MTVGETLTEARYQAGLSVDELSERTRIRGTVIRSIEDDDYEACGGDLYVRGYVRALAGAVGIDAQPLIREYDLGRAERTDGAADQPAKIFPSATSPDSAPTSFDLPAVAEDPLPAVTDDPAGRDDAATPPPSELNATRYDLPAVRPAAAATSYDLPRVPAANRTAELPAADIPGAVPPVGVPPAAAEPPASAETRYDLSALTEEPPAAPQDDLMAAGYDLKPPAVPDAAGAPTAVIPALGPDPFAAPPPAVWTAPDRSGQAPPSPAADTARKRRRGLVAVGVFVILVIGGLLGLHFASGSTATKNTAAVSNANAKAAAGAKARAAAQASASASAARASASAQASASASAQAKQSANAKAAAAKRVTSLPVGSIMAFGPDGYGDGDDPGTAGAAIARDASQPWATQWYNTSTFGMLKHGTGLLLNLGGKATVTTVRLDLSPYQGADLQLRVGNGASLADLKVAATANGVGGAVKLTVHHPVAGRYLLIWFTQLAPNDSGQYQESVSHVTVTGHR